MNKAIKTLTLCTLLAGSYMAGYHMREPVEQKVYRVTGRQDVINYLRNASSLEVMGIAKSLLYKEEQQVKDAIPIKENYELLKGVLK